MITLRRKTHKEQAAELLVRIANLQGEILKLKGENAELSFELKQLKKKGGQKMKRERAKQLKDVFVAYAEGKTIQAYSEHYGKWIDLEEVNFCEDTKYRIKPKQKEQRIKVMKQA